MKTLLLRLYVAITLLANYAGLNAQTFTPLPAPTYVYMISECEGNNLHYLLFLKANTQNDSVLLYSFDGNSLTAVDGFSINGHGLTYVMGYYNNEIYIGGGFDTINGSIVSKALFKYTLSNKAITPCSNIFTGSIQPVIVLDIKKWNNQLLMGGSFNGGGLFNPLVIGSGTSWSLLDHAVYSNGGPCVPSNVVFHIYPLNDTVFYITGSFTKIDLLTVNSVARYNNGQWTALGNGLTDIALFSYKADIAVQYGKVFVSYIDSNSNPIVSYFNDTTWTLLQNNAHAGLFDLLEHACGLFVVSGDYALYDNQLVPSGLTGVTTNLPTNVFDYNGSVYAYGTYIVNSQFFKFGRVNCSSLTGIEQYAEVTASIYPNPFSTQLTFSLADNAQATVSLYNFLGQQVLRQTFTNATTINTEQLADGIYFYELRSNKETLKTGKVVKQ
ncbi:MAG: hypothetical protein JWO06_2717 [Bacteroidota bacterium]|nr:hypothetical protein [Bacteroidota bacterium]